MNNSRPLWRELDNKYSRAYFDSYNWKHYELLLFSYDFSIIFYGKHYKLISQEYKFLRKILSQDDRNITADNLMKQIGSKCKKEFRQKFSYRIKSKIKNKLKKGWEDYLPSYNEIEWMILDKKYEHNEGNCIDNKGNKHHKFQYCDFETAFDNLISVKKGRFCTQFRKK